MIRYNFSDFVNWISHSINWKLCMKDGCSDWAHWRDCMFHNLCSGTPTNSRDLSSNLITSISNQVWTHVPALKSLNLAKNRFRSLPSGNLYLSNDKNLLFLRCISSSSPSRISFSRFKFTRCTAQNGHGRTGWIGQVIDKSQCLFTINSSLDLSNNHLAAIIEDSALLQGTLPNLTRLNFANNSLRQIPARFGKLTTVILIYTLNSGRFNGFPLWRYSIFARMKWPLSLSSLSNRSSSSNCKLSSVANWIKAPVDRLYSVSSTLPLSSAIVPLRGSLHGWSPLQSLVPPFTCTVHIPILSLNWTSSP